MKRTNFLLKWGILLVLMFPAFGYTQNLLTNPDFSSGHSGWNYNGNSVETNPASTYGGSGSNRCAEIDNQVGLYKRVAVIMGNYYQFTIKATRRPNSGTPAAVGIRINIRGTLTSTNYINKTRVYNNGSFSYSNDVSSFYIPILSAETFVVISITAFNNSTTTGVIVDDLALLQVSATTFLPVSFSDFSGTVQNNKVFLNFSTDQETNNNRFEIERARLGGAFTVVGKIDPTNTSIRQSYSFTDNPPVAGTYQYRIKQIDNDGKSTYTKVISLKLITLAEQIAVFPTLAQTKINFALAVSEPTPLQIIISDTKGRILIHKVQTIYAGANQQTIMVDQLPTGLYYLQIKNTSQTIQYTSSFQKQ